MILKEQQSEKEGVNLPLLEDRDNRAFAISITLFLHLLIIWLLPNEVIEVNKSPPIPEKVQLELELIPEKVESKDIYVRATPDSPDRLPDKTSNISNRNQRAAQPEESLPDPDNVPQSDGDLEESNRLVQGDPEAMLRKSSDTSAQEDASSPMPLQIPSRSIPIAEKNPLRVDQEVESVQGIASILKPEDAIEKPENERSENLEPNSEQSPQNNIGNAQVFTPPQQSGSSDSDPRPRIRVEKDTSFGPIKKNREGAIQVGNLSFDSRYSEFGEYWRRVSEIIEARWRNLIYNTKSIPLGSRTRVRIVFEITRKGDVINLRAVESTAGKLAETVSKDAIESEAPFFDWTPEMIITMGDKTECSIVFFY